MNKFEKGIREVISQNSRYTFDEIQLTDPLDKFLSAFKADSFAGEVKRKFTKINMTALTNELFVSIKKVSELITNVSSYYPKL